MTALERIAGAVTRVVLWPVREAVAWFDRELAAMCDLGGED